MSNAINGDDGISIIIRKGITYLVVTLIQVVT